MKQPTIVLSTSFDHGMYSHSETQNRPHLLHFLGRVLKRLQIAEVLGHAPCRVDVGLLVIPFQEIDCGLGVGCDGFF